MRTHSILDKTAKSPKEELAKLEMKFHFPRFPKNGNLSAEWDGKVAGGRGWERGTGCLMPATC